MHRKEEYDILKDTKERSIPMADMIQLSKKFIEEELPAAPPLYVSVYLMTLAIGRDSAKVAETLHATESDVLRAWAYWMDRRVMAKQAEREKQPAKPALLSSERPEYSPKELAEYLKNQEVKALFRSAEQKLGRMLSQQDMSLLFSFHDWLGLPLNVIDLLLTYCTANGHRGMRYIEKVALSWAEEGIHTEEKAAEYIEWRKTGFRSILQAFGQNRQPVPAEEEYMKKWRKEYGLPLELICVACQRTVLQTGRASFPYADSILRQWRDAKVQSKEDIAKLDEAFAAKKQQSRGQETVQKPIQKEPPKPRQNRFINYTQSEWDFAELERLEREQREKW